MRPVLVTWATLPLASWRLHAILRERNPVGSRSSTVVDETGGPHLWSYSGTANHVSWSVSLSRRTRGEQRTARACEMHRRR